VSTNNDNLELVLTGWIDARRRDDVDAVKRSLHPDVVWQGVRTDLVCPDRDHVLANLRNEKGYRPDVNGLDLFADGDQVLLGIRSPDFTEIAGESLDREIYEVFTIEDGLIVRIDEFKSRDDALEAMRQHRDTRATGDATDEPIPPTRR
jgi:hypothetical protein